MPKRTDIKKILIIGSGPIIISQACEFDYSGTQACKALKEEGYEVVLINSNPATIMTDPEMADRTYIEPITPEMVCQVIERERPDALLPTLGGQTGLNCAVQVAETGILEKFGVEMIGARPDVIKKAEDRELFRDAMANINLRVPKSAIVRSLAEALDAAPSIGYPIIVRPSFTLGGTGGGIAYNLEDLKVLAAEGLAASMIIEVMLEESVVGWKEFELEVMRDFRDNVVIICSIENVDAMGVHTGDSITVAPAQTLTDREYQAMRDAAIAIIREIGVETGGSNIQFAIHPGTGEMVVIEMNPRVSRSSALASKATGFPIAKIAAKLAVGYTLDEIHNDITRETYASFEPTIDYCVVKIPRWAFEKFPGAEDFLTTSMKSVGEVMSIGRTFKEALQKGIRSLEIARFGLGADGKDLPELSPDALRGKLRVPNSQRLFYLRQAFRSGMSVEETYELTFIDPWFLHQIRDVVIFSDELATFGKLLAQGRGQDQLEDVLRRAKECGFSDVQLAHLWGGTEEQAAQMRREHGVTPVYKLVDTCAAEFEAYTPYFYSTYEWEDEARKTDPGQGDDPGGRPQPHRPGHRVRLLLLPGLLRLARTGGGVHHGELQPRDGVHRLRHLGQALLRAPDPGRRAPHRGRGEPPGSDPAVRRPDSAQPGGAPGKSGGAHHGYFGGGHRPGRGPQTLQATPGQARVAPAPQRHGPHRGPGPYHRPRHRLPGAGTALLRPGGPRHADRGG